MSQNTGDAGEDFTDAYERVLRDLRQDGDVGRVVRRVASTQDKYIDVYDYIHRYRQLHAKQKCSVVSIQQRRRAGESNTDSQCSPVEFEPSVQSGVNTHTNLSRNKNTTDFRVTAFESLGK